MRGQSATTCRPTVLFIIALPRKLLTLPSKTLAPVQNKYTSSYDRARQRAILLHSPRGSEVWCPRTYWLTLNLWIIYSTMPTKQPPSCFLKIFWALLPRCVAPEALTVYSCMRGPLKALLHSCVGPWWPCCLPCGPLRARQCSCVGHWEPCCLAAWATESTAAWLYGP